MTKLFHDPVLLTPIVEYCQKTKAKIVFDGTLGLGGHAEQLLEKCSTILKYYATDMDLQHLEEAKDRLHAFREKLMVFQKNFSEFENVFPKNTLKPRFFLLDLGICSNQIDDEQKGFSFQKEGPLKMHFGGENKAEIFLNEASEKKIAKTLFDYGELRNSRKIAQAICDARKKTPLKTTMDLRIVIEKLFGVPQQKKILTKVFQAIRIEVNDELEVLKKTLNDMTKVMTKDDSMAIISYHSLEDRIVKLFFREKSKPLTEPTNMNLHAVVSEPQFFQPFALIKPNSQEVIRNPRSRSACLRFLTKI